MQRHSLVTGLAAGLAGLAVLAAVAPAGPVWEEGAKGAEAGPLPGNAQNTTGTGPLGRVKGELTGSVGPLPDFSDMYLIRICDPEAFLATTTIAEGGLADFDTQLFLFQPHPEDPLQAFGRLANDDHPFLPTVLSRLTAVPTDGSPPIVQPGRYFLAISGAGREPVSKPGLPGIIFFQEEANEISGPDGPGGDAPINDWQLFGPEPIIGSYEIRLEGVTFGDVPLVDCNENGQLDACDITLGVSLDEDGNGIPDECEEGLPGDVDDDGDVDFADLVALLAAWGPCPSPPAECPADLDGNGVVSFADLLILLANFGA